MSFDKCMDIINYYGEMLNKNKEKIKGIKYPDKIVYEQTEKFEYIKEPLESFLIMQYYIDQLLNLNNENENEIQVIKNLIIDVINLTWKDPNKDDNFNDLIKKYDSDTNTLKKYIDDKDINNFNDVIKKYNSQTDIDILKDYIKILKNILSKILENKGKVRTFIRLKETREKNIGYTINDEKTKITTTCDGTQTFGPFKHIYDSISNEDLLKDGEVKDIINLLKSGVSSLLFSYGISGAGKSYTLFGKDETMGVVQHIINTLKSDRFKITIDSIKEEYVNTFVVTGEDLYKESPLSGEIYDIKKESPLSGDDIKKEMDINELVKNITTTRIENKRIKETPNNKESSRSHLYITFKISKDDTFSYFTVIDCAGRETPKEIFDKYFTFEKTGNFPGTFYSNFKDINININNTYVSNLKVIGETSLKTFKNDKEKKRYLDINKNEIKEKLQHIKDLIKEGFYINESLNHLIYFINKQADDKYIFNTKNIQTNITNKYDPSKYFYNPSDPSYNKLNPNPIKTIEILEEIYEKKGSSGINPKIIMFTNVRLEKDRCIDTNKSLEFAQQVKSTV
uniref:Kinesin motor domain-containing protein n=1 Tax=viral metagenome TaxID=1070528 RepID=A0A6C0E175_9ZZZZ